MGVEVVIGVWKREVVRYSRERSQFLGTVLMAILWLLVFGEGMSSVRFGGAGEDYTMFILPGIAGFSMLVTSIRSGFAVVREMEAGFFRVFLVAPISKGYLLAGKILGGATVAVVQGLIVLLLGIALGISVPFRIIPPALIVMLLLSIPFVALGLLIAFLLSSFEGLYVIANSLIMPLFFLSGALFPPRALPDLLAEIAYLNPLTYGVDALRGLLLGQAEFSFFVDLSVLASFSALMSAVAVIAFREELE